MTFIYKIFFFYLFGIKQFNKLCKKTFKIIYQMSCFVGHPVRKIKTRGATRPQSQSLYENHHIYKSLNYEM